MPATATIPSGPFKPDRNYLPSSLISNTKQIHYTIRTQTIDSERQLILTSLLLVEDDERDGLFDHACAAGVLTREHLVIHTAAIHSCIIKMFLLINKVFMIKLNKLSKLLELVNE